MSDPRNAIARRAIIGGAGLAAIAASADATGAALAAPASGWRPTHEPLDDWMEAPSRHRLVFDTTSADGVSGALQFARTFFQANQDAYKIAPSELSVIVIMRHFSTPFAFGDAVWAKYGEFFSELIKYKDPKTGLAPARNALLARTVGKPDIDNDATLSGLIDKGVRFAVCGAATDYFAMVLAAKTSRTKAAINAELSAGLIPNGHMAAAGIVALNRAQERGYALASVG